MTRDFEREAHKLMGYPPISLCQNEVNQLAARLRADAERYERDKSTWESSLAAIGAECEKRAERIAGLEAALSWLCHMRDGESLSDWIQRAMAEAAAKEAQLAEAREDSARLADALDGAYRNGADKDEPEGARWIELSDTLARKLADAARRGEKG